MNKTQHTSQLFLIVFLFGLVLIYTIAYLSDPSLPGNNNQYPEGWWGWFDQGQYLKAALAFQSGDLNASNFYYPPLYSFIGSFFHPILKNHLFFAINILAFIWISFAFIQIAKPYTGQTVAMLLFFATSIASLTIFRQYTIPWTTTLATALLISGLLILSRFHQKSISEEDHLPSILSSVLFSFLLGLLVPLRPLEAVLAILTLYPAYVLLLGIQAWKREKNFSSRASKLGQHFVGLFIGGLVGLIGFLLYNQLIFGSLLGGYFETNSSNGYFFSDLGEKFVSLFSHSSPLYLVKDADIFSRFPWVALSIVAMGYLLVRGDYFLRALICVLLFQFILYLPYNDLLPNGLYHYLNIHYFKWTFPFLGLLAFLLLKSVIQNQVPKKAVQQLSLIALATTCLLALGFNTEHQKIEVLSKQDTIIINQESIEPIDAIDIGGISGGFSEKYFGAHQLTLNGVLLNHIKDYRIIEAPWGIRILFISPVFLSELYFKPDGRLAVNTEELRAYTLSKTLTLFPVEIDSTDALKAFIAQPKSSSLVNISFKQGGNSKEYVSEGWSVTETWGTWTEGNRAILEIPSNVFEENKIYTMRLEGTLFQENQQATIVIADQEIARLTHNDLPSAIEIPGSILNKNGSKTLISIEIKEPISPKDIGINNDKRLIGLGVSRITFKDSD
ncbi:MAG: hypothetical protein MI867_25855 [Pseudomonadales bacterium]|nr:hypothetical protein [Pseudomonadales bacterium]